MRPRRIVTLTGQNIFIDTLTLAEVLVIDAVTKLAAENIADAEYLRQAQRQLREHFQTTSSFWGALSGATGAIYRDLWYRRQLRRVEDEGDKDRGEGFLKTLKHHPARLLHDVLLDSRLSKYEFARQLSLTKKHGELLADVFCGKEDASKLDEVLSLSALSKLLEKVQVSPLHCIPDLKLGEITAPGPASLREWLLILAFLEAQANCVGAKTADENILQFAERLELLFGWDITQNLDAIVKFFLHACGWELKDQWSDSRWFIFRGEKGNVPWNLLGDPSPAAKKVIEEWKNVFWGKPSLKNIFKKRT